MSTALLISLVLVLLLLILLSRLSRLRVQWGYTRIPSAPQRYTQPTFLRIAAPVEEYDVETGEVDRGVRTWEVEKQRGREVFF